MKSFKHNLTLNEIPLWILLKVLHAGWISHHYLGAVGLTVTKEFDRFNKVPNKKDPCLIMILNFTITFSLGSVHFCQVTSQYVDTEVEWNVAIFLEKFENEFSSPCKQIWTSPKIFLDAVSVFVWMLVSKLRWNYLDLFLLQRSIHRFNLSLSPSPCFLLFFFFWQEFGPFEEEGMVMAILDYSFDVLVLKLGVVKRVYCNVSSWWPFWKFEIAREKAAMMIRMKQMLRHFSCHLRPREIWHNFVHWCGLKFLTVKAAHIQLM